jgi:hypothetical protein
VVERLLDVLSLLAVMMMVLPFVDLPPVMMRGAQLLGAMALIVAIGMVLLSFWKERIMGWAHRIFGKIQLLDRPAIYNALENVIDGFAALRGRLGLIQIGLSLLCWAFVVAMAWTAAQAVHLDVPLGAIVVVIVITSLGMLIPSSPGYIGVFEYLTTVALAPFGVPKATALTFAIVYHGVQYITLSLSGVIALWVHGTSLAKAVQRFRQRPPVEVSVE